MKPILSLIYFIYAESKKEVLSTGFQNGRDLQNGRDFQNGSKTGFLTITQ
jgi:hypothetical protein